MMMTNEGLTVTDQIRYELRDMNPEIRAQWLADLRDGTRTQGHNRLRGKGGQQCCLDVLCEQASQAGIIGPITTDDYGDTGYKFLDEDGFSSFEESLLPEPVQKWAGLKSCDPHVFHNGKYFSLADLNDNVGLNFREIADRIEEAANGTDAVLPSSEE